MNDGGGDPGVLRASGSVGSRGRRHLRKIEVEKEEAVALGAGAAAKFSSERLVAAQMFQAGGSLGKTKGSRAE